MLAVSAAPPMPPSASKDFAPAVRPMLGHFKSHLKIGIVGLPNVGKSTFFNILTKSAVPVENFPFCTLESNQAHVNVMDERFDWLCQLYKPKSEVAVFLEIIDIPGLVRGANAGEGRGNAFLSDIRVVDEIFHVLRVFEDVDIIHVNDTVDPVRDLEIIGEELRLKDVQFVDKRIEDLQVMKSMKRSNYKKLNAEIEFCERVRTHFKEGKDIRFGDWAAGDVEILNTLQLLTAKPVVYLVNMSEKDFLRKKNKFLKMIDDWVKGHGRETIIPFSCAIKHKLVGMSEDEASNHCAENQLKSVIPKIIKTAFAEIHLIYFFTAGPDEVKCWQIRRQTKAPRAAGAIHTDFERGFICAESNQSSTSAAQEASGARRIQITTKSLKRTSKEVMKFEDLKELGSESAVKAAGKYKYEGNTYEVQDGDIILFESYLRGGRKK